MAQNYIKLAKEAYYEGKPFISDSQYDALVDLYGEDSVGSQVGADIPHYRKMYSLDKVYEGEYNGDTPVDNPDDWIVTHKLDGAAISILYIGRVMAQVLTRGDGTRGIDISDLFRHTDLIPQVLPPNCPGIVQINAEVATVKTTPNARNYASGALGLKSKDEFLKRDLKVFAYNQYPHAPTHKEDLYGLYHHGFTYVPLALDIATEEFEYPTDGYVWRINDNQLYKTMGFTSHHPRGAIAVKERSEGVKTTLLDVKWQTGKSGKVTPVAILSPVNINDAIVSRATLNNVGFIEALGLEIGDAVMVERAGDIIPRIIKKAE